MMGAHQFPVLGVEMMRAFPVLGMEMTVLPFCSQCPSPLEVCASLFDEETRTDMGEEKTGVYKCPLLEEEKIGLDPPLVGEERAGFHSAASLGLETPGDFLSPSWHEMAGAHPPLPLKEEEE